MKIKSTLIAFMSLFIALTLFNACSNSESDKTNSDAKTATNKSPAASNASKPDTAPNKDLNSPRRKVKTAVVHGLSMLKMGDIEGFIKAYLSPQILEQVLKKISLKEFAKTIAIKTKARFIATLTEAKALTPSYNEKRDLATYKLKPPHRPLNFIKLDGYWYIK